MADVVPDSLLAVWHVMEVIPVVDDDVVHLLVPPPPRRKTSTCPEPAISLATIPPLLSLSLLFFSWKMRETKQNSGISCLFFFFEL
jgi:hypothetical protein